MTAPTLEPTTERTLVFLGGGDPWLQIAVWTLGALVIGLTVYNHRRLLPLRRRIGMVALRAALILILLTIFYQPALLEEKVAVHRNTVVVLADTSESMSIPHGDTTRAALVRDLLGDTRALERLTDDHELAFLRFAEGVEELPSPLSDPRALESALTPTGRGTRITDALAEVRQRFRNQTLGGVVLITDGIDTTASGRRASLSLETQAVLRDLDAPIHVFTTAGDPGVKDIAVTHIAYNNFAFVLNATSLEATIEVHGYAEQPGGAALQARLLENGRLISTQTVALVPGQDTYRVRFEYVPRTLGKQVYAVEVEPRPDEVYAKNNARQVIVNVVRDKIRVVQVVGQPSWDERFMRNLLKENPNVDLVSFFILVNRFNMRPLSARETSLIPFPARELFEVELGGFDLVIFQNFNYGPFQTREYLPHIARFVREGGAFVMIGGPLSMSAGGYYGTPIMDVLPVEIPPGFGPEATTDEGDFRPRLTESGGFHPITRLALEPAANRAIWGDITALEGVNHVTRARDDAVVLLEHPRLSGRDGKPMPVVAVREVGEGRSMVVSTDSTWHWAFRAGGEGKDPKNYDTFWSNAIRWLIKDPELDLVKVNVLRETIPVGDRAQATVQVFRPDYRPAGNQAVTVVVRRRGPGDGPGQGQEVLREPELRTDAAGEVRLSIPVEHASIYEVEARSAVVTGRTAVGVDLFVGTESSPELERLVGNDRLVTNLAQATAGEVRPLDASLADLPFKKPEVIRVQNRAFQELWSTPLVLLVVALLFGLEWWLRRRYGYL